ncbi:hypothetical protein LCL89_02855 [Halobacillus yeomjeoni]|uniref:alpha/beta hydrolase family esterase n=1 Tax=Halobacillus yeomjeoni TaxID=311194 RepID=UPI001CD50FD8|nr:PHB depolymerase family esterase [Halobacillus yeomjeoni]MCA0982982.1 hypothetical protein [Halobacillus yeomjeoni]
MDTIKMQEIIHQNKNRTFYYFSPEDPSDPLPLVFCFHGAGSSARHHMKISRFHKQMYTYPAIYVFPEAIQVDAEQRMTKQWNEGRSKNASYQNGIDDVGFTLEIINWFKSYYPLDERRVYATGFSNGAAFSCRLGVECQEVFAGVGGVAGPIVQEIAEGCEWIKPMPFVFFMGTADPIVPFDGIYTDDYEIDQLNSADSTTELFAASWGEKALKKKEESLDECSACKTSYYDRYGEEKVLQYTIKGGGHTWPGGPPSQASNWTGEVCHGLDASMLIMGHLMNCNN